MHNQIDMTPDEAVEFVNQHGLVLEGARGPVPNLAEAVAGTTIQGSWWGHPSGDEIFALTRAVRTSKDVLVCRLVAGKITYVHRRLWPALARLAPELDAKRLEVVREVHTAEGKHRVDTIPFEECLPDDVQRAAGDIKLVDAVAAFGEWLQLSSDHAT